MDMEELKRLAYLKNELKAIYAVESLKIYASSKSFQDEYGLYRFHSGAFKTEVVDHIIVRY